MTLHTIRCNFDITSILYTTKRFFNFSYNFLLACKETLNGCSLLRHELGFHMFQESFAHKHEGHFTHEAIAMTMKL